MLLFDNNLRLFITSFYVNAVGFFLKEKKETGKKVAETQTRVV